jgi:DNA-binding XRE family transcriptional regulator
MTEHQKAKAWRESHNLTTLQLGEMIGYSKESVWAMERGEAPSSRGRPKGKVDQNVWRRYKCACAALDAALKLNHRFDW